MVTIDDLKKSGVDKGNKLEITLFEGAEFYDGATPAPTTNMQGYDPSNNMQSAPGMKITGYVMELKRSDLKEYGLGTIERVIMQNTDRSCFSTHIWYVDTMCIHSFRE
ncbi:hypothetical protein JW756_00260 [Candidatus Woesearchaeota archaeon]|nr:hypothetical protein [Candidatus Woesearchaeota archaeon]